MDKKLILDQCRQVTLHCNLLLKAVEGLEAFARELPENNRRSSKDRVELMFERVFSAIDNIPNFDATFINSIHGAFLKYGKLTDKQEAALESLHSKLCEKDR